jgi:hypothetical protein
VTVKYNINKVSCTNEGKEDGKIIRSANFLVLHSAVLWRGGGIPLPPSNINIHAIQSTRPAAELVWLPISEIFRTKCFAYLQMLKKRAISVFRTATPYFGENFARQPYLYISLLVCTTFLSPLEWSGLHFLFSKKGGVHSRVYLRTSIITRDAKIIGTKNIKITQIVYDSDPKRLLCLTILAKSHTKSIKDTKKSSFISYWVSELYSFYFKFRTPCPCKVGDATLLSPTAIESPTVLLPPPAQGGI